MSLHVVILAAGEGTRMRSATPKVVHPLLGRPLVGHVVEAARACGADTVTLVVSSDADALRAALADSDVRFAIQDPPRGTGDAAAKGVAALGDAPQGRILVINGDCPGIRPETLRSMLRAQGDADGTFLSVCLGDPTGCGRFIRDERGDLVRIVEEPDATPEQRAIREVNAGAYLFDAGVLVRALAALRPDNVQGELYLTDTLEAIRDQGGSVAVYEHDDPEEVHGTNDRVELARAEALLGERKRNELMVSGVTIRHPESVRIDVDVEIGSDTTLYPGVVLESGTRIGPGCTLYPNVRIARSTIGTNVRVFDGTVIEDAVVESSVDLGPYARLRPGAHVCEGARVGNFVEIKATRLGKGSKANHLSYLGNAEIGEGVNVGAGTITCNYDGVNKHATVIEDGAFIGSNTALVAPVRIGKGAYVGAGSTITKDVADAALGVARGRQVVKEGWAARNSPAARRERD